MNTNKIAIRKSTALKLAALTSTALVGLAFAPAAQAQEVWVGSNGQNWFNSANWAPASVPVANTDVTIDDKTNTNVSIFDPGAAARDVIVSDTALGVNGGSNKLDVSGTGTLTARTLTIGNLAGSYGIVDIGSSSAQGNAVSKVTLSGNLIVANSGIGSVSLNKGTLTDANGTIGANAGSNGVVGVSGIGAVWTNTGALTIADKGNGQLTIQNGGKVTNADIGIVGASLGSSGIVNVLGPRSTWNNAKELVVGARGSGVLNVKSGGDVLAQSVTVGDLNGGSGSINIDGAGSTLSSATFISVGNNVSGNLAVTNGGTVSDVDGYVGRSVLGVGKVTVDGSGSTWTNTGDLTIGASGDGMLTVSNGGLTTSSSGTIGSNTESNGSVTLTGVGSLWNTGLVLVGKSGNGSLAIKNGGKVTNGSTQIASLAGSIGDVTVDGPGSTLTGAGLFIVGEHGSGTLTVSNGGKVSTKDGAVGLADDGTGAATITGANSSWLVDGEFSVGYFGKGTLAINNGGTVAVTGIMSIGGQAGAIGDVTVDGLGSSLTSGGVLAVGARGNGALSVKNGASVTANGIAFGGYAGGVGTGNFDGAGTVVTSTTDLAVATSSSGTMNITGGAHVGNAIAYLGFNAGVTGTVTVSDAGSEWKSTSIAVGMNGNGALNILNGGLVTNGGANTVSAIGIQAGSTGAVKVDGSGSAWISTVDVGFGVGVSGHGTMMVSNGGLVSNLGGVIGDNADGTGAVTVTGAGSKWVSNGSLYVAQNGGAEFYVEKGGAVEAGFTSVGSSAGSLGIMGVDGAGSTLTTTGNLTVGAFGTGKMTISNGGSVTTSGVMTLGAVNGASGTLNIGAAAGDAATGAGSLSATSLQFGDGTGVLNFNHNSANYAFSTTLVGNGTLNQNAGITILTSNGNSFNGVTHVNGGTLIVDGSLGTGALDVQNGGTLGGVGKIGGIVTVENGGTLLGFQGKTLTMGGLTLAAGSNINATFATPGGAELFDVTGDLTLDGTINLASSGMFGPGVYKLMNYGGALTDNGLDIGATPNGYTAADFLVQTSVAGQVNLINNSLPNLLFWDGDAAGSANNNIVNGGSGVWSNASTNWTDANGSLNGVMHPQPGFGIFQGPVGIVTVDGSAGNVAVTGMQFASDGYTLKGASITLAKPDTTIRVGDGSNGGAAFNTTISSVLTGNGGLVKTDLGTLILTGTNDYTGGTTISGGTLQLGNGGTTGSVSGNIVNNGILTFNRADAFYAGQISGNGMLVQKGSGIVNLTGDSSAFTGGVRVDGGTLSLISGGKLGAANVYIAADAGSNGALALDGAGSSLTAAVIGVGMSGTGTLNIQNGGLVTDAGGVIGSLAGSTGFAKVDGAGSAWINNGDFVVGAAGAGTLLIGNGGKVTSKTSYIAYDTNSQGNVTVSGAGSSWAADVIGVGVKGSGTLNIQNGGLVTDTGGVIGSLAGSTGLANVDGAGSAWTNNGDFVVGAAGTGTLAITNGGKVASKTGYLGYDVNSQGTATVSGAGSSWTADVIGVGVKGTGTLNIQNGGLVTGTGGVIGSETGSKGVATVSGAGSAWTNNGTVIVGAAGTGTLKVVNGGKVTDIDGVIGYSSGSSGTAAIDGTGSSWTSSGQVMIGQSGNGALTISNGGAMSVTGPLTLASVAGSSGVLNIGAAGGSPAAAAGTLNVASLQFGSGTGVLNFNHNSAGYLFSTAMVGTGTINQLAGVTNLTANSNGFIGAVNVTGGKLYVNGGLVGGKVTVGNGAALGGNGVIGSLIAQTGSTIAPGNSIGTLNVAGNASFAAGSTYQVELNGAGQSDLIKVTGTAAIANGALISLTKVDAVPYSLGTRYTVLTADGGLTGKFTFNTVQLTNFVGLIGGSDAKSYFIDVAKTKTFVSAASTPNQKATAGALDGMSLNSQLVIAVAGLMSDAQAQGAYDQLSGEIHATAKNILIEDGRLVREAAFDRLRTADGTTGGIWGRALGSWGVRSGDGNAARVSSNVAGLLLGADAGIGENVRIGAVGNYSRSTLRVNARNSSGTNDSFGLGIYGGAKLGNLSIRAGGAYSWNSLNINRSAAFSGFSDQLSSKYKARTAQAFGELGYEIKAGKMSFEPFANLAYVDLSTDAFAEKGGVAALTGQKGNTGVTFTTLGTRAASTFSLGNDNTLTVHGMVGWRHAFDNKVLSTVKFAGSAPFTIAGVPIAKNIGMVDLGLDMKVAKGVSLGISYNGQFGSGASDNTVRATASIRF